MMQAVPMMGSVPLEFALTGLLDKQVWRTFMWLGDEGGDRSRMGGAMDPFRMVAVPLGSGLSVANTALGTCMAEMVVVLPLFLAASSFSSGLEGGVI